MYIDRTNRFPQYQGGFRRTGFRAPSSGKRFVAVDTAIDFTDEKSFEATQAQIQL
jgi:hypothetical protein